jgi:hypothetical protein
MCWWFPMHYLHYTKALFTIRRKPKRKTFYFYSFFTFDVLVVPNALFTLSNNQQN